jgi:aspartate/glutamate racemase
MLMKHLGILATTPEGAALCFRAFCQDGFAELGPHDHPDVTLDCIALARSLPAWQTRDYASVRATLSVSAQRLAAAGADFFACPDNTAHLALEYPGPSLPLPGLHIAEVVADQAARDGRQRVGLLGTSRTMTGPVYPHALAARHIATEIPSEHNRATLDEIIVSELRAGRSQDRGTHRPGVAGVVTPTGTTGEPALPMGVMPPGPRSLGHCPAAASQPGTVSRAHRSTGPAGRRR